MTTTLPYSPTANCSTPNLCLAGGGVRTVALLGGTFDPPTLAHAAAANAVLNSLDVDEVWMVPAGDPYQKNDVTDVGHRLAMVELAVAQLDKVRVCDIETRVSGPSYMADTLKDLSNMYVGVRWLLVVGADVAATFSSWKDPYDVLSMVQLVVLNRPPDVWDGPVLGHEPLVVDALEADDCLSSTMVRAAVREGHPIDTLVQPDVEHYIHEHGLYRPQRHTNLGGC